MNFDPCDRPLKIQESTRTPTPLGCEGSFPHILPHSREYVVWLPASFLAHNLANPGLGHEPNARVVTLALLTRCQKGLLFTTSPMVRIFWQVSFIDIAYMWRTRGPTYNFVQKLWLLWFLVKPWPCWNFFMNPILDMPYPKLANM